MTAVCVVLIVWVIASLPIALLVGWAIRRGQS